MIRLLLRPFLTAAQANISGSAMSVLWGLPNAGGDSVWNYSMLTSNPAYKPSILWLEQARVWPHLLKRFPFIDRITAIDISSGMHKRAIDRLHQHRAHKIDFFEDNVLESQVPDQSADFVVSTFGLKTFNQEQLQKLAVWVARVLKPGGSFALIEASDPKGWWLRPLYLFHLKVMLPLVERIFLRGAQDFAMIGTYSTNFGDASNFAQMLREQGLEVTFKKHFFGCATSVSGRRHG